MVEVEINLNPIGLGVNKKLLGKIRIVNTGKSTKTVGNYRVEFIGKNGKCFRKRDVKGYRRKADPVWKLMSMVMESYYHEGEGNEQDN